MKDKDFDFEVHVKKPDKLIMTYYPNGEKNEKDRIEFQITFPKEYRRLLEDANFLEGTQALILHLISTLELQMNENEFLPELIEIASLREVLYNKTLEIIQEAIDKHLSNSIYSAIPKNQRYNNFLLEIVQ